MSEVNWDKIVEDADESPRALLAKFLAEADDITSLVIIVERKSSDPDAHEQTREVRWESSGTGMTILGLMSYSLYSYKKELLG